MPEIKCTPCQPGAPPACSRTFADRIALISDENEHHPRMIMKYGKVTVEWWTHKIQNLHRNDFIMAEKTEKIYNKDYS